MLGITVEGHSTVEPAAIIANAGLRVGGDIAIPSEETRTIIKRLHNLRLFEDVQIYIEKKTEDGIYLLIKLKENPRLERIEISGNDELDEDDILKKIDLVKGQIITPQDISTVNRLIKNQYDSDGYLNAKIESKTITANDTTDRVVLKIDIDEGPKVKVDNIRFHGNKIFNEGDLKSEMKETNERSWWKFWQSNKFDEKKYKEDKELILAYYRKNGFRDAEILSDSVSYDETKRYLTLDIFLAEGNQYFVRNINWKGNTVYPSELLTERLGFKKGDIYNAEKFDQNLRRNEEESDVTSLYADNGYLWFQVEPEIDIVGADSLDITLQIHERNQFRVGRVLVSGNTKTYEKVIRRELLTKPGDFFSRQLIIRSLRQLQQLNYFNPESLKPDVRPVDDKTVDIEYTVEEKSSDTFNMSVGYSGAFGFSGGIGVSFNNFSLSEPQRGGAGQQMTFDYQFGVSNYYRTFSIGFTEPWMFNTPTLFGFNIYDTKQSYYADLHMRGAAIRLGRRFRWPDMYFRGDWTLRVAEVTYHPLSSQYSYYSYMYPEGTMTQIGISQVISRNSTDSPIFPARGSNFSLLTEIFGGPKLGDAMSAAKYHKHIFSADWYIPLISSGRITIMSSNTIGLIFPYGGGTDANIPYQDKFYMGGTGLGQISVTPLRGYEDNSIGPYETTGYGGKAMMKYTAEMRFAISLNPIPIYALLFGEAGNVWLDHSQMDMTDLRRSAGFGVRLLVNPIGLIGFDYGYGYDAATPDGSPPGWKFHFQFGKSF
ncbi:MAG: outer membrane protein assembly factor BamA [Bacteroidetes bacterium]|nr:outer membrane protein assembly factor BamA [Bacteroidota bacterium]